MRHIVVAAIVALSVPARAASVGILSAVAIDPEVAEKHKEVEGLLERELRQAGQEVVRLPPCSDEPQRCASAAVKQGVDEVAQLAIRKTGDTYAVRLTVRDASGVEIFSGEVTPTEGHDVAVRGLILRAFHPAKFGGTLHVQGAPPGSVILVDGLPISGDTAFVRVGYHFVELIEPDGFSHALAADVEFGQAVVVEVPARAATAAAAPRSEVPLYVAGGGAAGGIAMLIIGLVLGAVVYPQLAKQPLERISGDRLFLLADDSTGQTWDPDSYGGGAGAQVAGMALLQRQYAESVGAANAFWGVAVAGGVLAAVSGGAAVVLYAMDASE